MTQNISKCVMLCEMQILMNNIEVVHMMEMIILHVIVEMVEMSIDIESN